MDPSDDAADGLLTIAPDARPAAEVAAQASAPPEIADRYVLLDKLGEGGMGVVYSARDRLTGQRVAIKLVRVATPVPAPREGMPTAFAATRAARSTVIGAPSDGSRPALMALAREFRTLASIRHPHIISVIDYGFGPGREPYFTMELLVDARPLSAASVGLSITARVQLILQVLEALTYVHRRGVLHRDLKPANVLVLGDGEAARVKVLDFGIACLREPASAEAMAGTIAYMAPELFWGSPPSEATDLWAVAVMAHELLLGAHPFADRDADRATTQVDAPAPPRELAAADGELAAVLQRALARAPTRRLTDLAAFARELARAVGLPPPAESAESRESFLSSAAFVARREEMLRLREALTAAVAGHGSLWLIGGESGVGKSRLLDELRTVALVGGNRVVRGQAVSAGGAMYQMWQGVLRPLCLDAGLDDLAAGVLRAAVPDLAALLGRPIPEPPAIDPHAAETRFILAVEQLLRDQRAPLVILLEDLHWAEPASIVVLQRLARSVPQLPLLIVASHRDDERRELVDELPTATRMLVRRLATAEIALLSGAMLGEAGKRPELVALLARETEGNAFFVVEVLRALAEEAGALDRVGEEGLPAQVTAGGVQAVLARRLGRVPPHARPLLAAAAVFGRELDLRVLAALPDPATRDLDATLASCTASSVLEVHQDGLRFAHDKLRGELLAQLPDSERSTWHHRVATAIEQVHADDLGPHTAALAHHWQHADDPQRETPHRIAAGERAARGGAVAEAIAHLERARVLLERTGADPARRARVLGMLTRAYHAADRPKEAFVVLDQMLAEHGRPAPTSSFGLVSNIFKRITQHTLHRLWPATLRPERDPQRLAVMAEIGGVVLAIADGVGLVRSPVQLLSATLDFVIMAEQSRDPSLRVAAYAGMSFMLSVSPLANLSDGYYERARALLAELPDRLDLRAYVDVVAGAIHIHRGEWASALVRITDDLEQRRRMGDWRSEMLALTQGHFMSLFSGDMASARAYLDQLERLEQRLMDGRPLWTARALGAQLDLRTGALTRAATRVAEVDVLLANNRDEATAVIPDALGALCALRQGDRTAARRRAEKALARMRQNPPINYGGIEPVSGVIEVLVALWCEASGADRGTLAAEIAAGMAILRRFAASVPIARPRALLWRGRWATLRQNLRRAGTDLDAALAAAQRLAMPFDEALIHEAQATLARARGAPELAATHITRARELFTQLGATWHLTGESS